MRKNRKPEKRREQQNRKREIEDKAKQNRKIEKRKGQKSRKYLSKIKV